MIDVGNVSIKELRASVTSKAVADKASLAGLDARARTAADGKAAASTANAYLGYRDYAKAADLYRVALQKGGVDADTVNTRLGIALALSGQKAAAQQALGAVTPSGPRGDIARYWTIWVGQQS